MSRRAAKILQWLLEAAEKDTGKDADLPLVQAVESCSRSL